jgi:UDP-N-acetylglucosamine 2-epimerase (non-hydrolysing)
MSGALAAFHRGIPVGHVEAGLRSGNMLSPFPEEMNRRLISRLATFHFAATACNRDTLIDEGIDPINIFVTGNPVVDSLREILKTAPSDRVDSLIAATRGLRRIVLTTHRRESFGGAMDENLRVLRKFVTEHEDVALIFPVHPNPTVVASARSALSGHSRIHLIEPLSYEDFVSLLNESWLIVSDSGGVQEEAPTLGKPLLVLRENTERPEAIECGVARLVGGDSEVLSEMLDDVYRDAVSLDVVMKTKNPFGDGHSGERIADIVIELLSEVNQRVPTAAIV